MRSLSCGPSVMRRKFKDALPQAEADAAFIAASREAVPALLDYSTRQAVPLPVAERALMARGLLVDSRQ